MASDDRAKILDAMEEELQRSFKTLSIEHFEKPYFLSYQLKSEEDYYIWGRNGAVYAIYSGDPLHTSNTIYAEVRVGSHKFDNTTHGGIKFDTKDTDSYNHTTAPLSNNLYALKRQLWQLTDAKYKESLSQLLNKKGRMLKEKIDKDDSDNFSQEQKVEFFAHDPELTVDTDYIESIIRDVSAEFNKYDDIINSWVMFRALKTLKFFVNTEGSRIITAKTNYDISMHGLVLSDDGMSLDLSRESYFEKYSHIPAIEKLKQNAVILIEDLMHLKEAEPMEPYSGPAILKGEAAAVFFHEAIGHRLEGERQISDEEGQTFSGKLGEKILPDYITVRDNPKAEKFEENYLMGSYTHDDQGVPAQDVVLVKDGVLTNYLMSRTPIDKFEKSNGHGRHKDHQFPIARMGNLFVSSKKELTEDQLRDKLLLEVEKQKKEYGIIIKEVEGGETNTSNYSFQAFSGTPKIVYKVDLKTGKEKMVRGVKFVGTPLTSINKILATSDNYQVFNGFCGAESGSVPVSGVAPSILVEELELQKNQDKRKTPPILPPPKP